MIEYQTAESLLLREAKNLPFSESDIETISIEEAQGRILAEPIQSPSNLPPFANSAMDGFAVKFQDLQTNPNLVKFPILGESAAGQKILESLVPGSCMRIMTGARIPENADTVIKKEDVRESDGHITLLSTGIKFGDHIRPLGQDFRLGDPVLAAGDRISPPNLMVLAGLGYSRLRVFRKAKIAVLATGNEIIDDPKLLLASGQIRNSTSPFLRSVLTNMGGAVTYLGGAPDDLPILLDKFTRVLEGDFDYLITTGAVSEGAYDSIPEVVRSLGGKVIFHKVAIRPGKPIFAARIPRREKADLIFFGLPGNPISTYLGWRFFIYPFFREQTHQPPEGIRFARLSEALDSKPPLTCFYKAKVKSNLEGGLEIKILPGQMSFMTNPLLTMDAWAILDQKFLKLREGDVIPWVPALPA